MEYTHSGYLCMEKHTKQAASTPQAQGLNQFIVDTIRQNGNTTHRNVEQYVLQARFGELGPLHAFNLWRKGFGNLKEALKSLSPAVDSCIVIMQAINSSENYLAKSIHSNHHPAIFVLDNTVVKLKPPEVVAQIVAENGWPQNMVF